MVETAKDFFISYNKADKQWAEWIAWQLEEAGYSTVLQAWDFRPSSNFVLEMQKAAAQAERTIALLSPDYLTSNFAQPEWAAAFAKDPTGEKGLLLPVRVRECTLEGLLSQIIYIDLVGLSEKEAREALLDILTRDRTKPSSPPTFPTVASAADQARPTFPGVVSETWNIPLSRNPNFTGREDILADLRNHFLSTQSALVVQAIHGLGGIGKTQIAVEYAYRHSADYKIIWWLRAEEITTLTTDFSNLSKEIQIPEQVSQDQHIIIEAVRRWLEQHTGWLLIFDNAKDPSTLHDYLPRGNTGHIIITSRNPNWKGVGNAVPVQLMETGEAVGFLSKRTGQDNENNTELAEELGFLPLALEQAGAYIEETGKSVSDYLELLRNYQIELLERGAAPLYYPLTLRFTLEISLQQVEEESITASLVMALVGFLAPDNIPKPLLRILVEISTSPAQKGEFNELKIDEAVATLRRYSLIEASQEGIRVHRLVQAVSRERYKVWNPELLANGVVGIINKIFPEESWNSQTWDECSSLLPHAFTSISYTESLGQVRITATELLNKIASYLIGRLEYRQAKQVIEHALNIAEKKLGLASDSLAELYGNLGLTLHYLNENEKALEVARKALSMLEGKEEKYDSIGGVHNLLGLILSATGQEEEALSNYQRALEIAKKNLKENDPRIAVVLDNIGRIYFHKNDFNKALMFHQQAMKVFESSSEHDDFKKAQTLIHIAEVYYEQKRLAKALSILRRVLAIERNIHGKEHPKVAETQQNIGIILIEMNNIREATKELKEALAIFRKLGDNHPDARETRELLDKISKQ